MGPIGCPETSIRNYHYSLRNNPEERSYQLLRGGSLKSREEEEYFVHSRIRTPDRPTRNLVTTPTELPRLHNIGLYTMSDTYECTHEPMHISVVC